MRHCKRAKSKKVCKSLVLTELSESMAKKTLNKNLHKIDFVEERVSLFEIGLGI